MNRTLFTLDREDQKKICGGEISNPIGDPFPPPPDPPKPEQGEPMDGFFPPDPPEEDWGKP